jgi:cellulose synthase/poly-beta-1,6-N-acetylglucosamine synthase-like glycosyltransferase
MNRKSERPYSRGIRFMALAIAFVFTVTSVTWNTPVEAAPTEAALPAAFSIEKLAIPAEMGSIAKVSLSPTTDHRPQTTDRDPIAVVRGLSTADKFVVLIQDAHAVIDAQENITKILGHLRKNYGVSLTALEGAKGRLEPILLKTYPEPSIKRKILAGYEKRAELSGPEMAAVMQEESGEYRGMEDWGLYEQNYFAYLRAQEKKAALLSRWNAFKQTLDSERAKVYDPKLNEYHEARENFLSERASLLDLLIYLSNFKNLLNKTSKSSVIPAKAGIQSPAKAEDQLGSPINTFGDDNRGNVRDDKERKIGEGNEAQNDVNATMDVGYAELSGLIDSIGYEKSEKQNVLAPLVRKIADEFKTQYLRGLGVKAEMNFYNRYQAFMTGQITAGQMLQFMVQMGSEHGKAVKLTPALKKLLGHAELLSEIKGSRLYDELQLFLPEVEASLIKTPAQRGLADKYQKLYLLKDLISLEMTHQELSRYQKEADAYGSFMVDPAFKQDLSPALDFYQAALERDKAFMTKIEAMMKDKKQTTVAVVAGGFHTNGLESILKEKGISYAVVMPKIASLSGQENYSRVMKGEVSFKDYLTPQDVSSEGVILSEVPSGTKAKDLPKETLRPAFRQAQGKWAGKTYRPSYFDALMRHAAKALVEAVPIGERVRTLKTWRDNLIRELAKEGRITDAGKFLPYIDELLKNYPEAVTALSTKRTKDEILDVVRKELEKFKKDAFAGIWKTFELQLDTFIDGLKQLVAKKELNVPSVSALLDRASQAKPSMLAPLAALDPSAILPKEDRVKMPALRPGLETPRPGLKGVASPVTSIRPLAGELPVAEIAAQKDARSESRAVTEALAGRAELPVDINRAMEARIAALPGRQASRLTAIWKGIKIAAENQPTLAFLRRLQDGDFEAAKKGIERDKIATFSERKFGLSFFWMGAGAVVLTFLFAAVSLTAGLIGVAVVLPLSAIAASFHFQTLRDYAMLESFIRDIEMSAAETGEMSSRVGPTGESGKIDQRQVSPGMSQSSDVNQARAPPKPAGSAFLWKTILSGYVALTGLVFYVLLPAFSNYYRGGHFTELVLTASVFVWGVYAVISFLYNTISHVYVLFDLKKQTYQVESKYYSYKVPQGDFEGKWKPQTILVPIYDEPWSVVRPMLESSLEAIRRYREKAGNDMANLLICDDGIMVVSNNDPLAFEEALTQKKISGAALSEKEEDFLSRMSFYREHGIAVVARPKHGSKTSWGVFERRGFFKKGSNLNHTHLLVDALESAQGRGESFENALRDARQTRVAGNPIFQDTFVLGQPTIHDVILLLDKDSIVPPNGLIDTVKEFIVDPDLAYTQNAIYIANYDENWFTRLMSYGYEIGMKYFFPLEAHYGFARMFGHNAFIRKSSFKEAGYWREDQVGEDSAFSAIVSQISNPETGRLFYGKFVQYESRRLQDWMALEPAALEKELRRKGASETDLAGFRDHLLAEGLRTYLPLYDVREPVIDRYLKQEKGLSRKLLIALYFHFESLQSFGEAVPETINSILPRNTKFAHGDSEILFNPLPDWSSRGVLRPVSRSFFSNPGISWYAKIHFFFSMIAAPSYLIPFGIMVLNLFLYNVFGSDIFVRLRIVEAFWFFFWFGLAQKIYVTLVQTVRGDVPARDTVTFIGLFARNYLTNIARDLVNAGINLYGAYGAAKYLLGRAGTFIPTPVFRDSDSTVSQLLHRITQGKKPIFTAALVLIGASLAGFFNRFEFSPVTILLALAGILVGLWGLVGAFVFEPSLISAVLKKFTVFSKLQKGQFRLPATLEDVPTGESISSRVGIGLEKTTFPVSEDRGSRSELRAGSPETNAGMSRRNFLKGLFATAAVVAAGGIPGLARASDLWSREKVIYRSGDWSVIGAHDSGKQISSIKISGEYFTELKILHRGSQVYSVKGNGFLRAVPLKGTTAKDADGVAYPVDWGTSFVPPGFWQSGLYYHNPLITEAEFDVSGGELRLIKGVMRDVRDNFEARDLAITFKTPDVNGSVAMDVRFTLKALKDFEIDRSKIAGREGMKMLQASSMNIGTVHDSDYLVYWNEMGEQVRVPVPGRERWVVPNPVPLGRREVFLANQSPSPGRVRPSVYFQFGEEMDPKDFTVQGWVTRSRDENDDNVGIWFYWLKLQSEQKKGQVVGVPFHFTLGVTKPGPELLLYQEPKRSLLEKMLAKPDAGKGRSEARTDNEMITMERAQEFASDASEIYALLDLAGISARRVREIFELLAQGTPEKFSGMTKEIRRWSETMQTKYAGLLPQLAVFNEPDYSTLTFTPEGDGVLILGDSMSGKSSLAATLQAHDFSIAGESDTHYLYLMIPGYVLMAGALLNMETIRARALRSDTNLDARRVEVTRPAAEVGVVRAAVILDHKPGRDNTGRLRMREERTRDLSAVPRLQVEGGLAAPLLVLNVNHGMTTSGQYQDMARSLARRLHDGLYGAEKRSELRMGSLKTLLMIGMIALPLLTYGAQKRSEAEVRRIQTVLVEFKLLGPNDVDGDWGKKSKAATKKLQGKLGLPKDLRTGNYGPITDAAVQKSKKAKGAKASSIPAVQPASSIEISTKRVEMPVPSGSGMGAKTSTDIVVRKVAPAEKPQGTSDQIVVSKEVAPVQLLKTDDPLVKRLGLTKYATRYLQLSDGFEKHGRKIWPASMKKDLICLGLVADLATRDVSEAQAGESAQTKADLGTMRTGISVTEGGKGLVQNQKGGPAASPEMIEPRSAIDAVRYAKFSNQAALQSVLLDGLAKDEADFMKSLFFKGANNASNRTVMKKFLQRSDFQNRVVILYLYWKLASNKLPLPSAGNIAQQAGTYQIAWAPGLFEYPRTQALFLYANEAYQILDKMAKGESVAPRDVERLRQADSFSTYVESIATDMRRAQRNALRRDIGSSKIDMIMAEKKYGQLLSVLPKFDLVPNRPLVMVTLRNEMARRNGRIKEGLTPQTRDGVPTLADLRSFNPPVAMISGSRSEMRSGEQGISIRRPYGSVDIGREIAMFKVAGKYYVFNASQNLPQDSQALSFVYSDGRDGGVPDLFVYAYPVKGQEDILAIQGCRIDDVFQGRGLLRLLLDAFFERYPNATQTDPVMVIPAVNSLLVREYGFKPPMGIEPNAWVRKESDPKGREMLFADEAAMIFALDHMPPSEQAAYEVFRVRDASDAISDAKYFPLYLNTVLTRDRGAVSTDAAPSETPARAEARSSQTADAIRTEKLSGPLQEVYGMSALQYLPDVYPNNPESGYFELSFPDVLEYASAVAVFIRDHRSEFEKTPDLRVLQVGPSSGTASVATLNQLLKIEGLETLALDLVDIDPQAIENTRLNLETYFKELEIVQKVAWRYDPGEKAFLFRVGDRQGVVRLVTMDFTKFVNIPYDFIHFDSPIPDGNYDALERNGAVSTVVPLEVYQGLVENMSLQLAPGGVMLLGGSRNDEMYLREALERKGVQLKIPEMSEREKKSGDPLRIVFEVRRAAVSPAGRSEARATSSVTGISISKIREEKLEEVRKLLFSRNEPIFESNEEFDIDEKDPSRKELSLREKVNIGMLSSLMLKGDITPWEFYRLMQEAVDARVKVVYDLEERGEAALALVEKELGPGFVVLLGEPGISTRAEEFVRFAKAERTKKKDIGPLEMRDLFEAYLGEQTVYRGVALTEKEAQESRKNGLMHLSGAEAQPFLDAGEVKSFYEKNSGEALQEAIFSMDNIKRFHHFRTYVSHSFLDRVDAKVTAYTSFAALLSMTAIHQFAKDLLYTLSVFSEKMYGHPEVKSYVAECEVPRIFLIDDLTTYTRHPAIKTSDGETYDRNDPKNGVELFMEVLVLPSWIKNFKEEERTGPGYEFVGTGILTSSKRSESRSGSESLAWFGSDPAVLGKARGLKMFKIDTYLRLDANDAPFIELLGAKGQEIHKILSKQMGVSDGKKLTLQSIARHDDGSYKKVFACKVSHPGDPEKEFSFAIRFFSEKPEAVRKEIATMNALAAMTPEVIRTWDSWKAPEDSRFAMVSIGEFRDGSPLRTVIYWKPARYDRLLAALGGTMARIWAALLEDEGGTLMGFADTDFTRWDTNIAFKERNVNGAEQFDFFLFDGGLVYRDFVEKLLERVNPKTASSVAFHNAFRTCLRDIAEGKGLDPVETKIRMRLEEKGLLGPLAALVAREDLFSKKPRAAAAKKPASSKVRAEVRSLKEVVNRSIPQGSEVSFIDLDTGLGDFIPAFRDFITKKLKRKVGMMKGTEWFPGLKSKTPESLKRDITYANAQFPEDFADLPKKSFDIVTVNNIETAPGELAKRARELLKPRGILLVTVEEIDAEREDVLTRIINEVEGAGFEISISDMPADYPKYETLFKSSKLIVAVPVPAAMERSEARGEHFSFPQKVQAAKLYAKRYSVGPDEYYRLMPEYIDPAKKVRIDLQDERGQKAIDAITAQLGPEFVRLLGEPGLSIRTTQFIDFAKPVVDRLKGPGQTLTPDQVWDVRMEFKKHLGDRQVLRTVWLTPSELDLIRQKGMPSNRTRFFPRIYGIFNDEEYTDFEKKYENSLDPIKEALSGGDADHALAVSVSTVADNLERGLIDDVMSRIYFSSSGTDTVSVTQHREIALSAVKDWSDKDEDGKKLYLFMINMPEIYLLESNEEYFPKFVRIGWLDRALPTSEYIVTNKATGEAKHFNDVTDSGIEIFVDRQIDPGWIQTIEEVSGNPYQLRQIRVSQETWFDLVKEQLGSNRSEARVGIKDFREVIRSMAEGGYIDSYLTQGGLRRSVVQAGLLTLGFALTAGLTAWIVAGFSMAFFPTSLVVTAVAAFWIGLIFVTHEAAHYAAAFGFWSADRKAGRNQATHFQKNIISLAGLYSDGGISLILSGLSAYFARSTTFSAAGDFFLIGAVAYLGHMFLSFMVGDFRNAVRAARAAQREINDQKGLAGRSEARAVESTAAALIVVSLDGLVQGLMENDILRPNVPYGVIGEGAEALAARYPGRAVMAGRVDRVVAVGENWPDVLRQRFVSPRVVYAALSNPSGSAADLAEIGRRIKERLPVTEIGVRGGRVPLDQKLPEGVLRIELAPATQLQAQAQPKLAGKPVMVMEATEPYYETIQRWISPASSTEGVDAVRKESRSEARVMSTAVESLEKGRSEVRTPSLVNQMPGIETVRKDAYLSPEAFVRETEQTPGGWTRFGLSVIEILAILMMAAGAIFYPVRLLRAAILGGGIEGLISRMLKITNLALYRGNRGPQVLPYFLAGEDPVPRDIALERIKGFSAIVFRAKEDAETRQTSYSPAVLALMNHLGNVARDSVEIRVNFNASQDEAKAWSLMRGNIEVPWAPWDYGWASWLMKAIAGFRCVLKTDQFRNMPLSPDMFRGESLGQMTRIDPDRLAEKYPRGQRTRLVDSIFLRGRWQKAQHVVKSWGGIDAFVQNAAEAIVRMEPAADLEPYVERVRQVYEEVFGVNPEAANAAAGAEVQAAPPEDRAETVDRIVATPKARAEMRAGEDLGDLTVENDEIVAINNLETWDFVRIGVDGNTDYYFIGCVASTRGLLSNLEEWQRKHPEVSNDSKYGSLIAVLKGMITKGIGRALFYYKPFDSGYLRYHESVHLAISTRAKKVGDSGVEGRQFQELEKIILGLESGVAKNEAIMRAFLEVNKALSRYPPSNLPEEIFAWGAELAEYPGARDQLRHMAPKDPEEAEFLKGYFSQQNGTTTVVMGPIRAFVEAIRESPEIKHLFHEYYSVLIAEAPQLGLTVPKLFRPVRAEARARIPAEAVIAQRADGLRLVDMTKVTDDFIRKDLFSETDALAEEEPGKARYWEDRDRLLERSAHGDMIWLLFDREDQLDGILRARKEIDRQFCELTRLVTRTKGPENDGFFFLDQFFSAMQKQGISTVLIHSTRLAEPFYKNYFEGYRNSKGIEIPGHRGNGVIAEVDNLSYQFIIRLAPVVRAIAESEPASPKVRAEERAENVVSLLSSILQEGKQAKYHASFLLKLWGIKHGFDGLDSDLRPNPYDYEISEKIEIDKLIVLIPSGSTYLGAGREALVLKTPDGFALRIEPFSKRPRPKVNGLLQPVEPPKFVGICRVEKLPLTSAVSSAELKEAEDSVNRRLKKDGYRLVYNEVNPRNLHKLNKEFFAIDPGAVEEDPATRRGESRSELRLVDAPLVALTGIDAATVLDMMKKGANVDQVRAFLIQQGQLGLTKKKEAPDAAIDRLLKMMEKMDGVDVLEQFISSGLRPQLAGFEPFGDSDLLARKIVAAVMLSRAETGFVDIKGAGVRGLDVVKIREITNAIYDEVGKMPGSGVPLIVNNGPDAAFVLKALKKIEVPRLIVLYDDKHPMGRGWNDVSRVVMKYRYSARKPANALVGNVIKSSDGEALMAFLTASLGVEQNGILSILADFTSAANPDLKDLVCAAAVLIHRIYASASPMDQELMKVNPEMLRSELREKGIDLLALSARNGVLVMNMETLAQEFRAQTDIDKAA